MKQIESIDSRLKRVEMHDYFLQKIKNSMEDKDYIAATWLIYSCLENRYFRILLKYREKCKYCRSKSNCNKKDKNTLAISTKIRCVERLYNASVSCITNSFRKGLFSETLNWVKKRNNLMHELLSLEYYEDTDSKFKDIADEGEKILDETYKSCTKFRELFFDETYEFIFPEDVMEKCQCKPQQRK